MISDTCAKPRADRFSVPPKITSSIFVPRSVLLRCSPRTHRTASEMFDLPDPLGPTIATIFLSNSNLVFSGKDLNPCISIALKYNTIPQLIFIAACLPFPHGALHLPTE